MAWIVYVGRLFAAVVLVAVAVMIAATSLTTKEATVGLAVSAVLGVAAAFTWPRRPNAWRRDPPTDRQIAFARDLGIRIPRGISKGELSDMISAAKAARDAL